MLVVAKPSDRCWMLVDDQRSLDDSLPISFEGRFYFPTEQGLIIVDTSVNKPPQLVLVAKVPNVFPRRSCNLQLVENGGELILVYRYVQRSRMKSNRRCQWIRRGKDSIESRV
jgi:hypothetical protein